MQKIADYINESIRLFERRNQILEIQALFAGEQARERGRRAPKGGCCRWAAKQNWLQSCQYFVRRGMVHVKPVATGRQGPKPPEAKRTALFLFNNVLVLADDVAKGKKCAARPWPAHQSVRPNMCAIMCAFRQVQARARGQGRRRLLGGGLSGRR